MNIAEKLRQISEAPVVKRMELAEEFRISIIGHPEEAILTKCLEHAKDGADRAMLGRKCLPPPAELKDEGLEFKMYLSEMFCIW